MVDRKSSKKKNEVAKELLLAEHKYLSESFWHNEAMGENRVKFFITLVTAVITAIVTLSSKKGIEDNILLFSFALFSLLIFGLVTLLRIIKRNEVTDEYKNAMDDIRQRFKDHYDDSGVLKGYSPFMPPDQKMPSRKFGGLADTVAAMNSLLLAALSGGLAYTAVSMNSPLLTSLIGPSLYKFAINIIIVVIIIIFFIAAFIVQREYIRPSDKRRKAELCRSDFTHAGGVVVRFDRGEPQYLLVTAKEHPDQWVLPKGHINIKKDKTPAETAVREVMEETGFKSIIIDPVGTIRFQTDKEDVTVNTKFYLMAYIADRGSSENREKKWCTYKKAIKLVTFKDTKKLLHKAKRLATKWIKA